MNTNFLGKKVPKEKASQNCLSLMSLFVMLDSVIRVNKKYYPEALLEECKYEKKKKKKKNKMENLINDDFFYLSSSDNETDSDSDNETDNESDNDESNE